MHTLFKIVFGHDRYHHLSSFTQLANASSAVLQSVAECPKILALT